MNRKTKILAVVMVLVCAVTMLLPASVEAATVKLNATKKTIQVGKTTTLKVKGTSKKVTWSSSNKKIATVTSKGKVKGIKSGTCVIRAKVNKKTYKCKITVKKASNTSGPMNAKKAKANAEKLLRQYGLVTFVEDTQKAWDNGEYEASGWTYEEVMALAKNYKAAGYFVGYVTSDGNANDILNAYVGFGYIAYYLEYVGPGPDNGANAYKFKCYYY